MTTAKPSAIFFYLLLIISFLGFMDLSYPTILRFKNITPNCSLINGCETVLTSKYSTVGNIPISLIGALYYLVLIGLSSIFIYKKRAVYKHVFLYLATIGLAISLIYLSIQIFVLKALCEYCGFSDLMALGVFVISVIIFKFQN